MKLQENCKSFIVGTSGVQIETMNFYVPAPLK